MTISNMSVVRHFGAWGLHLSSNKTISSDFISQERTSCRAGDLQAYIISVYICIRAPGFFTVGQFAVRKEKKPNRTKPNLT